MLETIDLGGIPADVVRKRIKHVHLSVYPPAGRVRISAPEHMALDTIRVFAISVISDMGYPFDKADKVTHEFVLQKAAEAEPKMTKIITELLKAV